MSLDLVVSGSGLPSPKRRLLRGSTVGTLAAAIAAAGCGLVDRSDRVKQIRTFTDMTGITSRLEDAKAQHQGRLTDVEATRLINLVQSGRDRWNYKFIYSSRQVGGSFSYVLISPGSDGRLESQDLEVYFAMAETEIHDDPARDIVFRDGNPVTLAGK